MSKIKKIRLNEIPKEIFGKLNIIDVREPYEYQNYNIPGSKNIPLNDFLLLTPYKDFNQNETYYFVCQAGVRSEIAAEKMQKQGFNVSNLIIDWKKFC